MTVSAASVATTPDKGEASADGLVNVAAHLPRMAALRPFARAVVAPAGRDRAGRVAYAHLTFRGLDELSNRYANGLERVGMTRGTRTILMVKPSIEFFALTFGLFKIGAVPVLIDPGMGVRSLAQCLGQVRAEAFIGIPLAHAVRTVFRRHFRGVKIVVTAGPRLGWGGHRLADVEAGASSHYAMRHTQADQPAAILFTTGSTGPAKGVLYRHATFNAQVGYLRSHFGIEPGEIDLPTFPLFALFGPALGMTAILPDMDYTRPAHVDPGKIIEAIQDQGATNMFGSPALLDRVGRFGEANDVTLPTMRRVITAGAPVQPDVLERFSKMLPADAVIHTPYGATESLPIASITGREIVSETAALTRQGKGTCVGRPIEGMTARIIAITDDPIERWSDDLLLEPGQIGEIVVSGPVVTDRYVTSESATRLAKIADGDALWHRMGDVGYLDAGGRLWFCGRKAHRVVTESGTLFTIPCEAIFNQHPSVRRTALVGVGVRPNQRPVLCVELDPQAGAVDKEKVTSELLALGHARAHTKTIRTILYHRALPVDIRHNAKIFREKLAVWAAGKLA